MNSNVLCIYKKEPHNDSEIKSGDHIFLAAIGGIKKLPKSYVSHEVNNYFSGMEKHFSRDSYISLIRQFEGPGKRGKLSESKATKSNICVITNLKSTSDLTEKYSLGYIKLNRPYVINHFIFNFDSRTIATSLSPDLIKDESVEQKLTEFVELVRLFDTYILIIEANLPENIALFGEFENKWFLAVKDKEKSKAAQNFIDSLKESKSIKINDSKEIKDQVRVHQNLKIDIDVCNRIIGKMAFNFLASELGAEYVLGEKFDPIRNWILTGKENKSYVEIVARNYDLEKNLIPFCPEKAHFIIIMKQYNKLIAVVSFYGEAFSFFVKLANLDAEDISHQFPIGLICDWKNRKEFTLIEHIKMIAK